MNINRLFEDRNFLEKQIEFYIKTKQIRTIPNNSELAKSHLEKAKHNLKFYKLNKNNKDYEDWQIVVLYYALYQSCLALLSKKGYSSKSHEATILLLIKEYSISKDEAELINNLEINRDEAQMYTQLKKDRHDASYSTNLKFSPEIIEKYEREIIKFINKIELMLRE